MDAFDLSGQVAVVTGGGQGIGEGIAKCLSAAGSSVVVAARHEDRIARVASEIESSGGRAIAVRTDVTDRSALEALADAAIDTFAGEADEADMRAADLDALALGRRVPSRRERRGGGWVAWRVRHRLGAPKE